MADGYPSLGHRITLFEESIIISDMNCTRTARNILHG